MTFGQNYKSQIDSLGQLYKSTLSKKDQTCFDSIIENRSLDMFIRIDTSDAEYIYIVETFNKIDSSIHTTERYFSSRLKKHRFSLASHHKILPFQVIRNNQVTYNTQGYYAETMAGVPFGNIYEFYNTLDTIKHRCGNLQPIEELSYDHSPALYNFSNSLGQPFQLDTSNTRKLKEESELIRGLKNTYQVITLINKASGQSTISYQLPASHPRINAYFIEIKHLQW